MNGVVFNIQRFSIHDGPGIRTTVFLKGCNLRCFWCHNPESLSSQPEVQFFPEKCILCGACVATCPNGAQLLVTNESGSQERRYLRDLCQGCFRCISECFSGALVQIGRSYSEEEILEEIERDREYYRYGQGGVTFSGGEPLLQKDFLVSVLKSCQRQGIHCAVDTAGNVAWNLLEEVVPWADLFLFDMKAFDEETHRRATGSGNRRIQENLRRLTKTGKEIWIRIPVIPGVNDSQAEIDAIGDYLAPLSNIRWVELLPFHTLGSEKYPSLDRQYTAKGLTPPSNEKMASLQAVLEQRGLAVRIMK